MMWGNLKNFSSDKINIDLIGVNSNEVTITLDMGYFEGQKLIKNITIMAIRVSMIISEALRLC